MGELLWEKPHEQVILRCKGSFLSLNDDKIISEYLLQGVEDLYEFRELVVHKGEGPFKHRLLFIGRFLKEDWLRNELGKCLINQ